MRYSFKDWFINNKSDLKHVSVFFNHLLIKVDYPYDKDPERRTCITLYANHLIPW